MSEFPIIQKLGGREVVFEQLRERCGLQTIHALRMWRQRGQIPGQYMLALLEMAEREGIPYCARDFELCTGAEGG